MAAEIIDPKAFLVELLRCSEADDRAGLASLLLPGSHQQKFYATAAIHAAAARGHAECVRMLIPFADPELSKNTPALIAAADNGHLECVNLLIRISNPTDNNSSALTSAVWKGHAECVEVLILVSGEATVNKVVFDAAYHNHVRCLELLLDDHWVAGEYCPPRLHARMDDTLSVAARRGSVECVHLLMPFFAKRQDAKDAALREAIENERAAVIETMAFHDPSLISAARSLLDASNEKHRLIAQVLFAIEERRSLATAIAVDGSAPPKSMSAPRL